MHVKVMRVLVQATKVLVEAVRLLVRVKVADIANFSYR